MKINAFILAAGFGRRLRPLSLYTPKPLLPVIGSPIIEYVIDKLLELPIQKIGINLHHLGYKIEKWSKSTNYFEDINFFFEDTIMGTGGALLNAKNFLQKGRFIVHNSDILSDFDIEAFYNYHLKTDQIATLAIHNINKYNHLGINKKGNFVCVGREKKSKRVNKFVTFSGIAIYEPEFLKYLLPGVSSVTDCWHRAVYDFREKIGTFDISSYKWSDLGTIDAYVEKIINEITARGDKRFIGDDVYIPPTCNLDGFIVLESGCQIGKNTNLNNCIVMSDGIINDGDVIKNHLVFKDKKIPIKIESEAVIKYNKNNRSGGSNRIYTTTQLNDGTSAIVLKSNKNDATFKRQIEYTKFFKSNELPVPGLLDFNLKKYCAVFEYISDIDLYSWFHKGKSDNEIITMYKNILDQLIIFQTIDPSGCSSLYKWIFDFDTLLWESNYFFDRFVIGYLNINPISKDLLKKEFIRLANRVDKYPKLIIHRDFQSQNIMLKDKKIFFIDYQGARIGPPAYDAVSLIFDPYCPLSSYIENELCNYYFKNLPQKKAYNHKILEESFLYCSLQRHMQALGAYGYLSKIKGKKSFEAYIPRCVELLAKEAAFVKDDFPYLRNLLAIIAHTI